MTHHPSDPWHAGYTAGYRDGRNAVLGSLLGWIVLAAVIVVGVTLGGS